MTTDTRILALAELEQRRQALAFEVEQGRDGADQELEAVEAQLAQLKRQQERQALVEQERAMRAEAETQAAAEAARRQAEGRLGQVLSTAGTAALEVEAAWIRLERAAMGLLDLGREAYALDNDLRPGRPRQKLRFTEQLAGSLAWRLSELLPQHFPRPDRQLRQPVPHLIAGLRGTGTGAAPEPER